MTSKDPLRAFLSRLRPLWGQLLLHSLRTIKSLMPDGWETALVLFSKNEGECLVLSNSSVKDLREVFEALQAPTKPPPKAKRDRPG